MAQYRHPGRGVVKPGIHRDRLSTPEYCMFLCMLTIHCSPAGVTAIISEVVYCLRSFITALYFMYGWNEHILVSYIILFMSL